jgi:hypothetical protein
MKCESIVNNVYAPLTIEERKIYLKYVNLVAVSYDTSNHKYMNQLTTLVRYFQACDLEKSSEE